MAEITRQFDAVNLRRNAKYLKNGLTVTSDNVSIHPRDAAGNIILQENAETNPLLIIEPTISNISNSSMLKILNTRFEYFKFPVTTTPIGINVNLQTNVDSITNVLPDIIYSRFAPIENQTITNADFPGGLEFSEVVDGQLQSVTNGYYITKEIKNSGTDLRFRIKINYTYVKDSDVQFTIIKGGPDFPLQRIWKGPYLNDQADNTSMFVTSQTIFIDEIIPNSQFEIGDIISIGAYTKGSDNAQNIIIADQTYWVITDASKNVDLWNQTIE